MLSDFELRLHFLPVPNVGELEAAATVAQTGRTPGRSFYGASFLLCIIGGGVWTQTTGLLAARRGHTPTIKRL